MLFDWPRGSDCRQFDWPDIGRQQTQARHPRRPNPPPPPGLMTPPSQSPHACLRANLRVQATVEATESCCRRLRHLSMEGIPMVGLTFRSPGGQLLASPLARFRPLKCPEWIERPSFESPHTRARRPTAPIPRGRMSRSNPTWGLSSRPISRGVICDAGHVATDPCEWCLRPFILEGDPPVDPRRLPPAFGRLVALSGFGWSRSPAVEENLDSRAPGFVGFAVAATRSHHEMPHLAILPLLCRVTRGRGRGRGPRSVARASSCWENASRSPPGNRGRGSFGRARLRAGFTTATSR